MNFLQLVQRTRRGGQVYNPVTDWSIHPLRYETDSFSVYPTADGSTNTSFLPFDDYATARRTYLNPRIAKPTGFTELNTREIKFNTILDADYTLSFDYYAIAEELELEPFDYLNAYLTDIGFPEVSAWEELGKSAASRIIEGLK